MRILNWVQNKFSGKQERKRYDTRSGSARHSYTTDGRKEEFSDWPEELLAIGTFGNREKTEEPQRHDSSEETRTSQDPTGFTLEEVFKLQKELTKLLALKSKYSSKGLETGVGDRANLPLNRFLNCPSSLEIDPRANLKLPGDEDSDRSSNNGDLSPNNKIILNKAKDILADSRNAIKHRSLFFLLKKMFVCRSGFRPSPNLRDPIPETRMDEILRILLHKKICTQNPNPSSTKKFLEDRPGDNNLAKNKREEKGEDGCQWVKTDSEYIVLEI